MAAGARADVDERDETVSKRIRDAELEKIPRVVVYGDASRTRRWPCATRGGGQATREPWRQLLESRGACYASEPCKKERHRSSPSRATRSVEVQPSRNDEDWGRCVAVFVVQSGG